MTLLMEGSVVLLVALTERACVGCSRDCDSAHGRICSATSGFNRACDESSIKCTAC